VVNVTWLWWLKKKFLYDRMILTGSILSVIVSLVWEQADKTILPVVFNITQWWPSHRSLWNIPEAVIVMTACFLPSFSCYLTCHSHGYVFSHSHLTWSCVLLHDVTCWFYCHTAIPDRLCCDDIVPIGQLSLVSLHNSNIPSDPIGFCSFLMY
jgi:hypothetical protein